MPTILVVDDNRVDLKLAGAVVEEQGSRAVFAEDGQQALKLLERNTPDVVLTDLQMPEIDGLTLVERIRNDHPNLPVVLMTAHGSEEIAAAALKAGASSYVPKHNLKAELAEALRTVLTAVEAEQDRDRVRNFLRQSDARYVLGCEHDGSTALVSFLQEDLARLHFCNSTDRFHVGTALAEALANAIDHGNLELDSVLRETDDFAYGKLRDERASQSPYRDRKVHVLVKLTPSQVTYTIRDEGGGFDPSTLPDPFDPESLLRPSGRGLTLIRTFMDEVSFNDDGNEITMVKKANQSTAGS
jgi:CheY-like chemotaxis protein/anti-sigma regulatory factor (Ser/Thr protein kinase)